MPVPAMPLSAMSIPTVRGSPSGITTAVLLCLRYGARLRVPLLLLLLGLVVLVACGSEEGAKETHGDSWLCGCFWLFCSRNQIDRRIRLDGLNELNW